ncbi:MAG: DUF1801 domain-containing protein [Chloroflexi bacterium]|nr:DUF1801 domain-containing protein [Chloroflexota bacterium]
MPTEKKTPAKRLAAKHSTTAATRTPPDLTGVEQEIRALLEQYAPPLEVRTDAIGGYHLWSVKDIIVEGRKKKDVYFAGVIPRKGYIGFYYMPVYTNPERKAMLKPELLALLKGMSCFHVRHLEPPLKKQIKDALASGFKLYKQRGWV